MSELRGTFDIGMGRTLINNNSSWFDNSLQFSNEFLRTTCEKQPKYSNPHFTDGKVSLRAVKWLVLAHRYTQTNSA